jgi:hypothetical protein
MERGRRKQEKYLKKQKRDKDFPFGVEKCTHYVLLCVLGK